MDGIDLAREVKMRWPLLPVILTSGHPRERIGELPLGVDYMPKTAPQRADRRQTGASVSATRLIPAFTASSLDFDDLELNGDDLRRNPLEPRLVSPPPTSIKRSAPRTCLPLCG
jgi:hypothetical protein